MDTATAVVPSDDLTQGTAWASSPLGNPADQDDYHSQPADVSPQQTPQSAKLRGKTALIAAGVVGAIGVTAALGLALVAGQSQSSPTVPNPTIGSVTTPLATSTPEPAPTTVTPPDTTQPTSPPSGGGGTTPVPPATATPPAPAPPARTPAPAPVIVLPPRIPPVEHREPGFTKPGNGFGNGNKGGGFGNGNKGGNGFGGGYGKKSP